MKRIVSFFAFALVMGLGAQAQDAQLSFCGTPAYKSEWLERYQQNPQVINRTMMDTIYVPMTLHVVSQDNGSGAMSMNRLMDAFCQLNSVFEQAAIQFYIKDDIRYISNSNYFDHDNTSGRQMMETYNVPNTFNCYIVGDPNGACGYYQPSRDAVALGKSCLGPNDFTWAHEAGHFLSLPHTFYGWETTDYNYDSPTPNTVTWSNITRAVERVNGTNCSYAGDGFCDTSPDYLNFRWNCNGDSESGQIQKDPNGVEFRSDGTLIMAYSNDGCTSIFTDGQIGAMRANLEQERPGHIANQTPPTPIASTELTPIFPEAGAGVQNYEAFDLQWAAIPGAEIYFVDISRLSTFSFTIANYVVTTNSVSVGADELAADKTYYWRIRPFNRYDACTGYSDVFSFELTDLVSSTSARETVEGLRIYPNPAQKNQEVVLEFASEQASTATLSLLSLTGQALRSQRSDITIGANRMSISTAGLPKGLYLVRIDANGGANYRKLVVQ
ncbi:MAG: zinc-dependent metalloprotease [Phaeodactylibacter sp.]|nr:zinc-dependent metalloprotease [Phaeodactylibacter sp.]